MSQFIRREKATVGGAKGSPPAIDPAFASQHPALLEYLTLDRFDDGSRRETASITLFFGDGSFKACLNDRSNKRVAFVSADSPIAVLGALEKGIQEDSLDWRPVKTPGRR